MSLLQVTGEADPTPFGDDEGFCRYCAFLVATSPAGRLLVHSRTRNTGTKKHPFLKPVECGGSGRMQHVQREQEMRPFEKWKEREDE